MEPEVDAPASFSFHGMGPLPSLQAPHAKELLTKWNLDVHGVSQSLRFDQHFAPQQLSAFLVDLFNSEEVQRTMPVCTGRSSWGSVGKVSAVQAERLGTSQLRLDFFDRLEELGIVRNGAIAKCLDVPCGEVIASDKLRVMLLDQSSEEWEAFNVAERRELLFQLLQSFAVGGGLNQYDEHMDPYLEMCKAAYKDLLAVQKDACGKLQVRSVVLRVTGVTGSGADLFPRESQHGFCFVCIDPLQRNVKMWYHAWFPMM